MDNLGPRVTVKSKKLCAQAKNNLGRFLGGRKKGNEGWCNKYSTVMFHENRSRKEKFKFLLMVHEFNFSYRSEIQ